MRWFLEDLAWLIGGTALLTLAGAFILDLFLSDSISQGTIGLTAFTALPCVLAAYSLLRERRKIGDWLRTTPQALLLGVSGGALLMTLGTAYEALLAAAGWQPPDMARLLREAVPWPVLICVGGVLAPIGEEMYFRGRLLDAVTARSGPWVASGVTALAFGLLHGIPVLLPVYVFFGLLLVLLRRLSGGLVAPILAHLLNNLLGLLLS